MLNFWRCDRCGNLSSGEKYESNQSAVQTQCAMCYEQELKQNQSQTFRELIRQHASEQDPKKKGVSKPTIEEALGELQSLVGLREIKEQVQQLVKQLEGQKVLQQSGKIKLTKPTLHMVFYGDPGTGKTHVARILAKILFALGVIKENKCIETDRSGLVAQWVGHTAIKTREKIQEAMGGVLFIDEAHTLAKGYGRGEQQDFGQESIDTLVKAMEDHRDHLVVILAGYHGEMEQFLDSNEGLRSRIPHFFYFREYTPIELTKIAKIMLASKGYACRDILAVLEKKIELKNHLGAIKGNARWVRNLVERIEKFHMIRIGEEKPIDVTCLKEIDVYQAFEEKRTNQEGLNQIKRDALQQLQSLIGLQEIKRDFFRLTNYFSIQKQKEERNLSSPHPISMHMVFQGPPGTGKTHVARIVGQLFKGANVLTKGHFLETTRFDLVSPHVGETAEKVKRIIQRARGGILFIDEAYSLALGDISGQEGIDTLIKEMEENREDLVVILAGYEQEMDRLLTSNPGLRSRISYHFNFPHYSAEEIAGLFERELVQRNLMADPDVKSLFFEFSYSIIQQVGCIHGNGRWVRTFVDQLEISQNNRILLERDYDFMKIKVEDLIQTLKSTKIAYGATG